ncbi:glycosyltransferase [Kitasatospora sp. NBC_01266]|uniref:glycosyltransferase n=1 Tax=Kitasatospora sp. NBC_01266 TaxID=2903572 RepID=UPI002E339D09|nr:glycosyltransferase [Kitasatospora sp. NBC_01266]
MNGSDRRPNPACPRPAARDSLYTPVQVVELDLEAPGELRSPGGQAPTGPDGRVLALVRLRGHPLGLVTASGAPGDRAGLCRLLVDAAHRELAHQAAQPADLPASSAARAAAVPPGPAAAPPLISVIVATHNRVDQLQLCLDSLLRGDYPRHELIVVDNAPSSDDARTLVRTRYPSQVRYLREPVAGLARAHNRALAAARGTICAFTDDDTLADPGWLAALARTFAADPRVGCVTGLVLPAELQTPAQAAQERLCGFTKGFRPASWSLARPPRDPLFPFTAGSFGTGANMAFRTAALRGMGGFDPATGVGTPAKGGDDLLAFFRTLAAGWTLAYQPEALIWHRHQRRSAAVVNQAFGYGAGCGAFLLAALAAEPGMLPALVRRLPGGVRHALRRRTRYQQAASPGVEPTGDTLVRQELRGLAYGPFGYLRSRARELRIEA